MQIIYVVPDDVKLQSRIIFFVKLCIIMFTNVNISVVTPHYLYGKVELKYFSF